MWLHIRGVGQWTNRLYDYFEKEQEKLHCLNEDLPMVTNTQTNAVASSNNTVKLATGDTELDLLKAYVIYLILLFNTIELTELFETFKDYIINNAT